MSTGETNKKKKSSYDDPRSQINKSEQRDGTCKKKKKSTKAHKNGSLKKKKKSQRYLRYQIVTIHQVIITNAPRGKIAISRISRRVVINQDFLLLCWNGRDRPGQKE